MSELTTKQKKFCDEYLIDLNGSRAYRAVYGDVSEKTARANASRTLALANVKSYIEPKAKKNTDEAQLSAELVLREMGRIAFSDVRKLFDEADKLLSISDLPDEIAACIDTIEFDEKTGKLKKYKLNSKVKGLEMLGRYFKLFIDQIEHSGPDKGPIEVKNLSDDEATKHYLDSIKS